jgi:phosphatidylserine/phosphatidylglycerophosphate/cardiolipin synthase-like enzyme
VNILKASSWTAAVLIAVLSLSACSPHAAQPTPTGVLCRTEAHFSRRGDAAPALVNMLDQARSSIHVAIYGLTNPQIVDTLLEAKRRGVDVALKLDKVESAGKAQAVMITKLQAAGVPVEVSEQSRLLHHKFAVIDGRYVVTGSYNWTESAERRNRENMVILECAEMVEAFSAEWESIQRDKP